MSGGHVRSDRRVVTVLFADLVGFTTLAEGLDAEDVAMVQDRYFSACSATLTRHGGQVEKYIGDAVVATFGVPRARDDDAPRAVAAALEVVDAVVALAAELGNHDLAVRVGVNTGEVVVTYTGGEWRLSGDVVNTAARLQAAADPGSVLVGVDTALAVENHFALEPVGPVPLKGKSKPLPAWTVTGRAGGGALTPSPLVGRTGLLTHLRHTLTPGSRPVMIVAPPGMGKTRLATELAARLEAEGITVRMARVDPDETAGYQPVADLLRSTGTGPEGLAGLARHLDPPTAELTVAHAQALLDGRRLGEPPEVLFASWLRLLDTADSPRPTVWIIEDLHNAGSDLLGFVDAATRRGVRSILLTSRSTSPAGDERSVATAEVVHLEPLDTAETRRLLESLVGVDVLRPSMIEGVTSASGGNPLFVEELVRSWLHTGRLVAGPDGGLEFVGPEEEPGLPTTVRAVYLGLLDDLPVESRSVATSGAVAGITFPSSALRRLGVSDPAAGLDHLTGVGLLAGPHPDGLDVRSFSYRHALMRDTAYETLPRAHRAVLHLRYARWLQGVGDPDPIAELIGLHLSAAHATAPSLTADVEGIPLPALAAEAAEWLEQAAHRIGESEPERAAALWDTVVALTPTDDLRRVHRRLCHGEALRRAGRLPETMEAFAEVGELAGPTDAALRDAALGYEEALFASRLDRRAWGDAGHRLLAAALDVADDPSDRARLLAASARARAYEGDREADQVMADAADLVRAFDDPASLAFVLRAARATKPGPDHLVARVESSAELVEVTRRSGNREALVEAQRLRLIDLLQAGDIAAADDLRAELDGLIAQLHQPLYLWYPPMWAAMRAILDGDGDGDDRVATFAREGERWHYPSTAEVVLVQRVQLAVQNGGEPPLEAIDRHRPFNASSWSAVQAYARIVVGDHGQARRILDDLGSDGFARLPDDLSRSYVLALLIETAAALGDVRAAGALEDLLVPWAGQNIVVGSGALCLGAADRWLALAAGLRGDPAEAAVRYASALELNQRMGAVPAAATVRRELGELVSPRSEAS